MKWSGIFPPKYYKEIFRLYNWDYDPTSTARPSCVGSFTKKYVYGMLPPGILDELKAKTPIKTSKKTEKAYRQNKYYQRLTETGIEEVENYVDRIMMFMEMCDNIEEFKGKYERVFEERIKAVEKMKEEIDNQAQLKLNI